MQIKKLLKLKMDTVIVTINNTKVVTIMIIITIVVNFLIVEQMKTAVIEELAKITIATLIMLT